MRSIITALALAYFLTSCGQRSSTGESNLKFDISVPPTQINSESIVDLMTALVGIQTDNARGTLRLSQLIAVIPFTQAELEQINKSREQDSEVVCANSLCTGTNSGSQMEIVASRMNIPTIGVPHVGISENIKFKFRLTQKGVLDICSIEGFAVKKLVFWSEIHAAQVKMDENSKVTQAIITAAPTGYKRCI
jgi:hypothetical protein